ncbi:AAA family ATPase [Sphingomonas solaris]|uniref:AAA family ATPase n=1 Tax=Alterirhizorhabdus solaris TaxID=2529389 RepID=A0A558R9I7_9SPHN|nr:AAA family ATPase [Sphingomonas solaris]TVV76034.1 AAA family ATPase [Sphingomonas solaris]
MTIRHIHVEGGFLTGLDLRLKPGLNVLIGARGTGKTSVIELIRYVFGTRSQTAEDAEQSLKHARATLADGEIVLTASDILDEVTLSRTATEDGPRSDGFLTEEPPIIFSQKEIENVALSEQGRLNLIDAFLSDRSETRRHETDIKDRIRALDRLLKPLRTEVTRLEDELAQRAMLTEKVANLERQQAAFRTQNEIDLAKQERVALLSRALNTLAERDAARGQLMEIIGTWAALLTDLPDRYLPDAPEGDAELAALGARFQQATEQAGDALQRMEVIRDDLDVQRQTLRQQRVKIEGSFREARKAIEDAIAGAGVIEKSLHEARRDLARLDILSRTSADRASRLVTLLTERDALLDDLEKLRGLRFRSRADVANRLNLALQPKIKVSITRSARYAAYTRALIENLRGSGLKYNDVAITLAQTVSPRELVRYVENGDFESLARASGLPRDRAVRVINALSDAGTADVLVVTIEDAVRLRLLDGTEYKDISDLSAGQRCTVILPIIFQHSDRILIIDQPEDHIDNAFIVETLIQSLRKRADDTQIILATHNANIPVLGNADWVVQLVSDGRHGSVAIAEPLEGLGAVGAITSIMEGGLRAFRDRASFYDDHAL